MPALRKQHTIVRLVALSAATGSKLTFSRRVEAGKSHILKQARNGRVGGWLRAS